MVRIYDEYTMREAFGEALVEEARKCEDLFAISADTGISMGYGQMCKNVSDRVVNVGICEQNMALFAAGIAACGGKVVVATYAPFASMRMLEQIRTYIACENFDIKIVSGMGGLSAGEEGISHQGIEDISIMRCIPNMVVIVAADACSTREITHEIIKYKGPVYLRLGRNLVPKVFEGYSFKIGKANIIKDMGDDLAIICNGAIIQRVLEADELLEKCGVSAKIIEMPCVKPIDKEIILKLAKEVGKIVTVEENNVIGGLGGAVAEILSRTIPTPLLRLGIQDKYTQGGPYEELLDLYGFSAEKICEEILKFIEELEKTCKGRISV